MSTKIIMLLAIGFLFACTAKDKKEAGPVVKVETEKPGKPSIHYSVYGKSGGPVLLFVHGWCINSAYWNKQVEYFKDKYQVVTVDLAGHGQSPANSRETSADQLAAGVDSVIDYLELKNIILIGHSMAGDINLHVMNSNPETVTGFIGIDNLKELGRVPAPAEEKQIAEFLDILKKDYKNTVTQYSLKYLFHPKTDSAVIKRVISDIQSVDSIYSASIIRSLAVQYKTEQDIIPRMKIPLLLIISGDSLKDESSLKKYCTGGGYRYWTIKDCGHYPMIEKPDELNMQLEKAISVAVKADL